MAVGIGSRIELQLLRADSVCVFVSAAQLAYKAPRRHPPHAAPLPRRWAKDGDRDLLQVHQLMSEEFMASEERAGAPPVEEEDGGEREFEDDEEGSDDDEEDFEDELDFRKPLGGIV